MITVTFPKRTLSLLLCLFMGFLFIGCTARDAEQNADTTSLPSPDKTEVTIGEVTYQILFSKRNASSYNGNATDIYTVEHPLKCINRHTVSFDAKTGELIGFNGITPFPQIEAMDQKSDEELREIVEGYFDFIDFSVYNTFELLRPASQGVNGVLRWKVREGEMLLSVSVDVTMRADGTIWSYDKTDVRPTQISEEFIEQENRTRLLEKALRKKLGLIKWYQYDYRILSEVLTEYNGKNAIAYTLSISDEDGFSRGVIVVTVVEP